MPFFDERREELELVAAAARCRPSCPSSSRSSSMPESFHVSSVMPERVKTCAMFTRSLPLSRDDEQARQPVDAELRPGREATTCSGVMSGRPSLSVDVEARACVVALRLGRVVAGELRLRDPLQLQGDLRRASRLGAVRRRRRPTPRARRSAPRAPRRPSTAHALLRLFTSLLRSGSRQSRLLVTRRERPRRGRMPAASSAAPRARRRRRTRCRARSRATIAAQARAKLKSCASFRIFTPSAFVGPPKYSPTIAPIIESTLATFSPVKMNGSEVGIRTRRKIASSPARVRAHQLDRRGSHARSARAACSPSPGRSRARRRSPSSRRGSRSPNQLFVIGAKAMIGIAFAATAKGMSARAERRGSARGRAPTRIPSARAEREPAERLLERVDARSPRACPLSSQNACAIVATASAAGTSCDVEQRREALPGRDPDDEDERPPGPSRAAAADLRRRRGIGSTTCSHGSSALRAAPGRAARRGGAAARAPR